MKTLNRLISDHKSGPNGFKQALNQEGKDKLTGLQERCNMESGNNIGVDINREPLKRNIYLETPSGLEAINENGNPIITQADFNNRILSILKNHMTPNHKDVDFTHFIWQQTTQALTYINHLTQNQADKTSDGITTLIGASFKKYSVSMSLRIGQHQPSATYTLTAESPTCLFSDSSMHLKGTIEITYETKWDTKTSKWYWQITNLKASPLMLMLINNQLPAELTIADINALNMYTKITDNSQPDVLNNISTKTRHLAEIIKALHTNRRLDLIGSIAEINDLTDQKEVKDIYRALAGTHIERSEQLHAFAYIIQKMHYLARVHISGIHNPESFFCGSKSDRRRAKATLSLLVLMIMHIILEFFSRKYKDLPEPIRVTGHIILLALDSICSWFFLQTSP